MTDSDLMPYGKYKGEKMANVPASYLLWLYENDKCSTHVLQYIRENYDVLKAENMLNKVSVGLRSTTTL